MFPYSDNFAALNSAVFSDGSFVYIFERGALPMELSTLFSINAANTGQFERYFDRGGRRRVSLAIWKGVPPPQRDEEINYCGYSGDCGRRMRK